MVIGPNVGRIILATAPLLPHMAIVATSAIKAMLREGAAANVDMPRNVAQSRPNLQYIKINESIP